MIFVVVISADHRMHGISLPVVNKVQVIYQIGRPSISTFCVVARAAMATGGGTRFAYWVTSLFRQLDFFFFLRQQNWTEEKKNPIFLLFFSQSCRLRDSCAHHPLIFNIFPPLSPRVQFVCCAAFSIKMVICWNLVWDGQNWFCAEASVVGKAPSFSPFFHNRWSYSISK